MLSLEGNVAKASTAFNTTGVHLRVLAASVGAFRAVKAASNTRTAVALEQTQVRPGGPLARNHPGLRGQECGALQTSNTNPVT